MLNAIRSLHANDAIDALDTFIQRLLPTPSEGAAEMSELDRAILTEVRAKLNLREDDYSAHAQGLILDVLTRELRGALLPPELERDIRIRLANEDQLPPGAFTIAFGPTFRNRVSPMGVSAKQVEHAIRHCDVFDFEPVPEMQSRGRRQGSAMFAKTIVPATGQRFTLVVEAIRREDTLEPVYTWRAYHSLVRIDPEHTDPKSILRAFVATYGLEFPNPSTGVYTKFVEYEVVHGSAASPPLIPSSALPPGAMFVSTSRRDEIIGVWRIGTAYVIDTNKYMADLRALGVKTGKRRGRGSITW